MKKYVWALVVAVAFLVCVFGLLALYSEKEKIQNQYKQLEAVYVAANAELLKYKMDPDRLQEQACQAFKDEDEEGLRQVITLLEQYHPQSNQHEKAKNYLKKLEDKKEERRIAEEKQREAARLAEERKFFFDICGIKLGMSSSKYNALISRLKSSGKLSLYDRNLYSMFWFRSEKEVRVKSYGASSSNNQTFSIPMEYFVLLDKKPVFVEDKLVSLDFLVFATFDDGVIVENIKNIDLISDYVTSRFEKAPELHSDWWRWRKNNQMILLRKTKLVNEWDGLAYYRLKLTR